MQPRDQRHSRNPEPAGPRRENHGCRRGRPASDKLTSTEEFTHNLPLSHRKLILFLLAVFLDSNGTLQTMYAEIVKTWGHVEGHWAKGKNRKKLTEVCGRYLGAGADRVVQWKKIEDAARATLPAETATWVLTYAAGLYDEVQPGQLTNKYGYTGERELPTWAEGDTPVEFKTIADWLASHEPQLTLPSTVIPTTTKRGPSGASPSSDLSEVMVPAQPGRNGLDAAAVVARLELVERELDEARAELEVRRATDNVTQEELRLCHRLIASLTRTLNRLMRSEGKQPLEAVSDAEVQRRYEEAQHEAEVLRLEIASLAKANDQHYDLLSDPSPEADGARSKQDGAADAPVIGVGE